VDDFVQMKDPKDDIWRILGGTAFRVEKLRTLYQMVASLPKNCFLTNSPSNVYMEMKEFILSRLENIFRLSSLRKIMVSPGLEEESRDAPTIFVQREEGPVRTRAGSAIANDVWYLLTGSPLVHENQQEFFKYLGYPKGGASFLALPKLSEIQAAKDAAKAAEAQAAEDAAKAAEAQAAEDAAKAAEAQAAQAAQEAAKAAEADAAKVAEAQAAQAAREAAQAAKAAKAEAAKAAKAEAAKAAKAAEDAKAAKAAKPASAEKRGNGKAAKKKSPGR
jgi:Tfp pilus assembly protein FimV